MIFLIWSFEHKRWWRERGLGYTESIREAGQFSYTKALEVCRDANRDHGSSKGPNIEEAIVPATWLVSQPRRQIVITKKASP